MVNEMIVQASHDIGACYGVSKCAEIVFERGKMIKGEGLPVLQERMETIDPDDNENRQVPGSRTIRWNKQEGRDGKSEDRTNQKVGIVNQDQTE